MFGNKVSDTYWRFHNRNGLWVPGSIGGGGEESSSSSSSSSSDSWDVSRYEGGEELKIFMRFDPDLNVSYYNPEFRSQVYEFRYTVSLDNAAIIDTTAWTHEESDWFYGRRTDEEYNGWVEKNNFIQENGHWMSVTPIDWNVTHRSITGSVTYGTTNEADDGDTPAMGNVSGMTYYLYTTVTLEAGLNAADLAVTLSGHPSLVDNDAVEKLGEPYWIADDEVWIWDSASLGAYVIECAYPIDYVYSECYHVTKI